MDNASFHRSEELAVMAKNYDAKILYCPAYSPFVNAVEFANRYLKNRLGEHDLQSE